MKRLICAVMILGFTAGLIFTPMAQGDDSSNKILKEGILGAATGAVAAGASGGKAGKGEFIGPGTNDIGGAVFDTIFGGSQKQAPAQQPAQQVVYTQQPQYPQPQQVVYVPQPPQQATTSDAQVWYQKGYQDGFKAGYQEGMNAQRPIVVPSRE